jgi:hypothetical protein
MTFGDRWNDYTDSLFPFPTILGCLITSLFIIILAICVYKSGQCPNLPLCFILKRKSAKREAQAKQKETSKQIPGRKEVARDGKVAMIIVITSILLVLISDQSVFIGEREYSQAVYDAKKSLRSMKDTFFDLTSRGDDLDRTGVNIGIYYRLYFLIHIL